MVFVRRSRALLLAVMVLHLMPSGVLRNEVTSDLTAMSIPGSDPVSDQDVTYDLDSLFESAQKEPTNCEAQLVIAKSLLEKLLEQLSHSKERLRGMSGIAIRYQGNRTSLNELLNSNHQQLLAAVDDVVRNIHKWKMNTYKWGVGYRQSQDVQKCCTDLHELQENFNVLFKQFEDCDDQLEEMKNSNHSREVLKLVSALNRTEGELHICNDEKGYCENERNKAKSRQEMWKNLTRSLNNTNNQISSELSETKVKLGECYKSLTVNIEDKEKFDKVISYFEKKIGNDTNQLQIILKIGVSNANTSNLLLKQVQEKYEALRSVCKMLVRITRSRTTELSSCQEEKSNLGTERSDLKKSVHACKNDTENLKRDIDQYQKSLHSCNETKKQREFEINQTLSQNTQLKNDIRNLTEIVKKCNDSLQEKSRVNMNQVTEMKGLNVQLNLKEDRINKLEQDKKELNNEINRLNNTLDLLKKENQRLINELKIKNNSLETCEKSLKKEKSLFSNYKSSCENNLNASQEKHEKDQQRFTKELEKCKEINTNLTVEKNSLESEKESCTSQNEKLKTKLTDEAKELRECIGDRLNLTNTIVFKNRDIEDLKREYDNMNLTSKLGHIKISTRISELEIKLRYLEYLLKSNRNEIKMLEEYGVILIMLVNKNADMLTLLKETFMSQGEGLSPVMDDRLEALLRRLLRSVEDHHSRIYTQLLQMKPYMDKVVPIRVRRQVQRGRPPEVALLGATKENNMTEVGILLDVGANVNVQDDSGLTPLHWAAMQGHADVAELLLCRGAEPNVQAQGKAIKTPLHLAAEYGHPDTVLVLLDFGSNIEARALDYATPLLYAANRGREQVVRILLLRGADVWSTNAHNKNIFQLGAKFPKVIHVVNEYTAAHT